MSQASAPTRMRATTRRGPGAVAARQARLRLRVVPAAIERSGTVPFAVVCMGLLVIGLLLLLLLNTQLAQGAFAVDELTRTSGTLADEEHELTQALDAERNPAALAERAVRLGMVPATSMAFIRLTDGAIIGVAEPATAEATINLVTDPQAPPPAPAPPAPAPAEGAAPIAPAEEQSPAAPATPAEEQSPAAPAAPAAPAIPAAPAAPAVPAEGAAPAVPAVPAEGQPPAVPAAPPAPAPGT